MTPPSVRAASPPGQDHIARIAGKTIAKCRTSDGIEIFLSNQAGDLVLIRPSVGTRRGTDEDIAAWVTPAKRQVVIEWNEWHREVKPEYMPEVEAWTRRQLGVAS